MGENHAHQQMHDGLLGGGGGGGGGGESYTVHTVQLLNGFTLATATSDNTALVLVF